MKRILLLFLLLVCSIVTFAQGKAKYVFFFIGDGMGFNQVQGCETYRAAIEGRIGIKPLLFASFPHTAMAVTNSASNGITDSAAGGTALACGKKTKNDRIGTDVDGKTRLESIAEASKKAGKAVGICTSVSIDHATPASFYAHVENRSMFNKIGHQLIESNFDYFGGSDFLEPKNDDGTNLYDQCTEAGYTICKTYADYKKKAKKADKVILLQSDKANAYDHEHVPYAINRQKGDMTLAEITRAGISTLVKADKENKGFFMMIEGGLIDWACHTNDAATVYHEVCDMDDAVRVAYEFYEQHPDETLIVVSADHETGGLGLGIGNYEQRSDVLAHQRMSSDMYTKRIKAMREEYGRNMTWDMVRADLRENWGFWSKIKLNENQTNRLQKAYDGLMSGLAQGTKSLYQQEGAISSAARKIMQEIALIGWTSGTHTNSLVPVFAIGADAELFHGRIDNTDIPKKIAEALGINF